MKKLINVEILLPLPGFLPLSVKISKPRIEGVFYFRVISLFVPQIMNSSCLFCHAYLNKYKNVIKCRNIRFG